MHHRSALAVGGAASYSKYGSQVCQASQDASVTELTIVETNAVDSLDRSALGNSCSRTMVEAVAPYE